MKNFIQEGTFLEIIPTKSCKSGDLYVEGNLVGVAITNSDTPLFSIATRGVFELPKAKESLKVGQKVYSKNGEPVTATNSEDTVYVGVCISNSDPNDSRGRFKIG